jgi:four helix bundle protein
MTTRHPYPFEKLNVWQAARSLTKATYLETSHFPAREIYGLTSQCNRAAVSVAANIAEGSSRRSRKDQAHFSETAYGSLMELACLFVLSNDLKLLSTEREAELQEGIEGVSAQLNALHRSQLERAQ